MKTVKQKNGISLIVLVITISVIIILAAAVILTINNNNPMSNANKARYESDRANVQNALSAAIGKICAEKLSSANIPPQGDISTGIEYTLNGANDGVVGGKIGWDKAATNVPAGYETTTILGLKMPQYTQDTVWSVNKVGQVLVTVGENTYGPEGGSTPTVTIPPTTAVEEDTKYQDPDSENQVAVIPKGFQVSSIPSEQKINTGLVVIAPDNSEFVWVPVKSSRLDELIDTTHMRSNLTNWTKNGDILGTPITYLETGFREPDILINRDNTITNLNRLNTILGTSFATADDLKAYQNNEFTAIYHSIKTNGGFYIGRYETGDLSKTAIVSKSGNTDIGSQSWYTMYAKQNQYAASLRGTNVKSNMIYGFQWDATMKWFASSSDPIVKNAPVDIDNAEYANFSGIVMATGSLKPIQNIFDMAGNIYEWTAESFQKDARVIRGGCASSSAALRYVGYRDAITPTIINAQWGNRMALYL